jgi:hypothetical protein
MAEIVQSESETTPDPFSIPDTFQSLRERLRPGTMWVEVFQRHVENDHPKRTISSDI